MSPDPNQTLLINAYFIPRASNPSDPWLKQSPTLAHILWAPSDCDVIPFLWNNKSNPEWMLNALSVFGLFFCRCTLVLKESSQLVKGERLENK